MMTLLRPSLIALLFALQACAHAPPAPAYKACTSPLPLELRLKRIEARLGKAYANAPPLTAAEHAEVGRLSACFGGAVLGALFLGIISNALPVINISPFWQMAISGGAIILAVVLIVIARIA